MYGGGRKRSLAAPHTYMVDSTGYVSPMNQMEKNIKKHKFTRLVSLISIPAFLLLIVLSLIDLSNSELSGQRAGIILVIGLIIGGTVIVAIAALVAHSLVLDDARKIKDIEHISREEVPLSAIPAEFVVATVQLTADPNSDHIPCTVILDKETGELLTEMTVNTVNTPPGAYTLWIRDVRTGEEVVESPQHFIVAREEV